MKRIRLPRLRRRGGTMTAYKPGNGTVTVKLSPGTVLCHQCGQRTPCRNEIDGTMWLYTHECKPVEVVARLHGGPCDGHAVTMLNPGPDDTIRIEDDEDPTQPDAVYVPRARQPDEPGIRDFDHAPEKP